MNRAGADKLKIEKIIKGAGQEHKFSKAISEIVSIVEEFCEHPENSRADMRFLLDRVMSFAYGTVYLTISKDYGQEQAEKTLEETLNKIKKSVTDQANSMGFPYKARGGV
jgi:hypothetical protein